MGPGILSQGDVWAVLARGGSNEEMLGVERRQWEPGWKVFFPGSYLSGRILRKSFRTIRKRH